MDQQHYRILLIDDDRDEFLLLKGLLSDIRSADFHLEWVGTYAEGVAALIENRHDAYLLDYRLNSRNGMEILRETSAVDLDATIIMLTGQGDYEVDIEAMRLGCADYLLKDQLSPDLLDRSIRHSIERKRAERELRGSNEALIAEIAERKKFEEALRLDEMRLEALWRLSHMSGNSDEEIAAFVLDQQINLTGSGCGALTLVKEDWRPFTIYGPKDVFESCEDGARFFGAEFEHKTGTYDGAIPGPVIINDCRAGKEGGGSAPGESPTRLLCVPLLDGGRIAAAVMLADRETEYDQSNVRQVTLMLDGMWRLVQRHRAEKAAREAENSLRLMADSLPALISYIDANERYRFVNRAYERYGISPDDIIGLRMEEVLDPADYALVRPHVEQALKGNQVQFEMEASIGRAKHFLSIWYVPNLNEKGGVVGFFALAHDLTERKRNEIEVQRRRDELAHVARVATMGELSSSLAHELGQPLTGILGNAQAALRFIDRPEPDIEEVKSALEDIVDDCRRAGNVIRKLRSILKKKDFEKAPVDINDLLEETLKLVASEALKKKVTIEAVLSPDLPHVMGDRVQLQQVLINLILNGFDAMARSEGDSRLMTIHTSADAGAVTVSVSDNGAGVDSENMDCIFDPFYTTKIEGIGMGLPISRYILETHQGRLWAERNATCGMTFSLSLPSSANR